MLALLYPFYRRSLVIISAVAVISILPLYAQAALPESIQAALTKAALSPDTISIIITPIGDKNGSRLPPVITVIDPDKLSANEQQSIVTPLITVDKQIIEQQERQLKAYTDDAYTHQSLENTLPILPVIDSATTDNSNNDDQSLAKTSKTKFLPLISHNGDIARTPASTMKLIPSFIALDTLGADFVWFTRVYHTGLIIGNRLQGDLIIQGSGDPKMTHERLEQLLYRVQQTGIRHIDGDIIVDSAIFNKVSKDPAAFDRSPLRPYNASPDGFLVNFNSLSIRSYLLTNEQAQLSYQPQLINYQLPEVIDTRDAPCSTARYSLAPQWHTDKLTFDNKLPTRCGEHVFYVAYPDAKDFASRVIAAKWQGLGNTLSGNVIAQETPYSSNTLDLSYLTNSIISHQKPRRLLAATISPLPLVSYPSLNLTQQIYDINHFSNNVMTEQVALSIGSYAPPTIAMNMATVNGKAQTNTTINTVNINRQKPSATSLYQFGKPTTTDYSQALQTMNQWWQNNLTTSPPYLTNGSGLCRDCTVTAANLSELLGYAYTQPSFDAYVGSLGVAGVSGTISHHSARLPDSAAIGRAWIKTGTLNNVTAMAGYVQGQSGQDYTVVGIINSEHTIPAGNARVVLDTMLDWTAQQ